MKAKFTAAAVAAIVLGALTTGPAFAQSKPIVGLITKTNTNPFFVKMREGAEAEAKKAGVELRTFAGKFDGDNQAQVEAVAGQPGIDVAGPAVVVAIGEVLAPVRPAGLLAQPRRLRQRGADREQVGRLPGLRVDLTRLVGEQVQLVESGGQTFGGAQYAGLFGHHRLQVRSDR